MANSNQSAVSDGTLVLLDVTIEYTDRADIEVYFDGVADGLPWAWVGSTESKLSFTPAVPIGVEVMLRRVTDVDDIRHSFTGGAQFTFQTLDENFQQVLQVAQEFQEGGRITDIYNDLDMHGYRIINQLATGGEGFIFKGDWQPNTAYGVNNIVYVNTTSTYQGFAIICTRNHVSSLNLNVDFLANWEEFAARGASGPGSGDLLAVNNLSDVLDPVAALSNIGGIGVAGGTFVGPAFVPHSNYDSTSWATDLSVPTKKAIRDKFESLQTVPAGTIIMWPGKTAPTGYAQVPFTATNVSRTGTYAGVFANLGTAFGAGDGSTTFGLPFCPEDYTGVSGSVANIGVSTTGQVKAHVHTLSGTRYYAVSLNDITITVLPPNNPSHGGSISSQTDSTGGAANLAAGMRFMYCIKL